MATISTMAGHAASWQQLLNGYQSSGRMGQQGHHHGWRWPQAAGRVVGQVSTANNFRQWYLQGTILRSMENYWGNQIHPKEENHLQVVFQNINSSQCMPVIQ